MENGIRKNQDLGTGYAFCCVVASVHSILSVGGKTGKLEVHKWLFLAWNYIWWAFFKILLKNFYNLLIDIKELSFVSLKGEKK